MTKFQFIGVANEEPRSAVPQVWDLVGVGSDPANEEVAWVEMDPDGSMWFAARGYTKRIPVPKNGGVFEVRFPAELDE